MLCRCPLIWAAGITVNRTSGGTIPRACHVRLQPKRTEFSIMLQVVLESVGLDSQTCAGLLGFNPAVFAEWSAGQRPIPESVLPLLSAVFSVPLSVLRAPTKAARNVRDEDITPAIWYKFRGPELVSADRECV